MEDPTLRGEYTLRDGTRVRIRPIEPRDGRTLQAGFRELSPDSRRRLFRGPKSRLAPRELRFLTESGGRRRLALGAVRIDADGWECEGLGLARYACLPDHAEVAEPSISVIDAAQGLGLGRLLAAHLSRAASARGVKTFRCLLADDNGWLRERIARTYPDARLTRRGPLLGAEFPLPALAPPEAEDGMPGGSDRHWSLLRWVAEGSARPRRPRALSAWLERALRLWRRLRARGARALRRWSSRSSRALPR